MGEEGKALINAILDFDEDEVIEEVNNLKGVGKKPLEIMEICKSAMDQVGKMFQEKEIFLTELIMSGELLKTIMAELEITDDSFSSKEGESKGKILIGTVKDDIHDIGKNIIKSLLISNGYEVLDIGEDVPIDKFVEEVKAYNPNVVAMSGLLTVAYDSMKATIEAFEKARIRNNFKVIIGGGATDQKVVEYAGADDFGASAIDGVEKINKYFE